jgi:hypothetical protein
MTFLNDDITPDDTDAKVLTFQCCGREVYMARAGKLEAGGKRHECIGRNIISSEAQEILDAFEAGAVVRFCGLVSQGDDSDIVTELAPLGWRTLSATLRSGAKGLKCTPDEFRLEPPAPVSSPNLSAGYTGVSTREVVLARLLEEIYTDFLTTGQFDRDTTALRLRKKLRETVDAVCGISTALGTAADGFGPCVLPAGHYGRCLGR